MGGVDVEISTHHPLFIIADCVYITNRKQYCRNVEWTLSILLGVAHTLVAYKYTEPHLIGVETSQWPFLAETCSFTIRIHLYN